MRRGGLFNLAHMQQLSQAFSTWLGRVPQRILTNGPSWHAGSVIDVLFSASIRSCWTHSSGQHDQEHCSDDEQIVDLQQVLSQLIRRTHAAEAAMAQVLAGQQLVLRNRPDAAFFADQEQEALHSVQHLLPKYRVRPSALLSILQGAGLAAGAAAALAPAQLRNTVIAALQESLTDLYNDQLRVMRAAGLSDEASDVRAVMLRLRDLERAAEGAPAPPDIMSLQKLESVGDLGITGVVGAAVKAVADAAIAASGKL